LRRPRCMQTHASVVVSHADSGPHSGLSVQPIGSTVRPIRGAHTLNPRLESRSSPRTKHGVCAASWLKDVGSGLGLIFEPSVTPTDLLPDTVQGSMGLTIDGPSAVTRAKFKLIKITKTLTMEQDPQTKAWDVPAATWDLEFTTVMGESAENKSFFRWSPSGQIVLRTVNPDVVRTMDAELNHEFYVDFTPAPRA